MHLRHGQTIFKKTEIKEDDDLRSYVNQGLLDGIRKFDPKRGSKFILRPHG
jgi:DNA-directed RNA polymerase specialized sigma subunit